MLTCRNNYLTTVERLRSNIVDVLQAAQCALDTAPPSGNRTTFAAHIVALLIASLGFSEIVMKMKKLMQSKRWICMYRILRARVGEVSVDGLVGTAANDND